MAWQWGLPGQCHLLAGLQVLGHNSAGQPLPLPPLIHNHYLEDSSNAEILSKYSKPYRNIDYQRSFLSSEATWSSHNLFCLWEVAWLSKEMSPHAKKSISVTIPLHFSPVKKHLVAWINFSRNDELIFTFLFIEFQTKLFGVRRQNPGRAETVDIYWVDKSGVEHI